MTLDAEDLTYRARALAQSHPLTRLAGRYVEKVTGEQRISQPIVEIGIWAAGALIDGYCLRRVEEDDAGFTLSAVEGADIELAALDEEAGRIAAEVRTGAGDYLLGDDGRTVSALDRMVHAQVDRRLDHWRDSIDEKAWGELEEYLTWWVVKGYALRIAETRIGSVA
jgi:hypothetical protein